MRLNSEGRLAKFYMWLPPDDKKLPQDLCTYFWGLVGRAFIVFVMGGALLSFIIYGIVLGARFLWANKIPTLFFLGLTLFAALMVWLSERKKRIKIEILSEAKAIIKGRVDGVKKRYCPRIEWERRLPTGAGRGDTDAAKECASSLSTE